jgi:hypothetical protein
MLHVPELSRFWLALHAQVSEYAASKRVVLKGDLPIGVDKRSVDTWMEVRRAGGCFSLAKLSEVSLQ